MARDIFPLILKLQGYPYSRALKEFYKISSIPDAVFNQWQKDKLWEHVQYHYQHNPFYKQVIGNKLPDSFEQLPILTKKDLQRPMSELLSEGFDHKDLYISSTSGSSGHPFFFAKDKMAHALTWVSTRELYKRHNISPGDLEVRFYGIPLTGRAALFDRIKDRLMNRIRFAIFDLSDDAYEGLLNTFNTHKVNYIYGYTNAIRHFSEYIASKGCILKDICSSLNVVIVTSEMCTPADKQIIEKACGVPVKVEYGASEVGIIAFENVDGRMEVNKELLYLETNENKELLITSFYNKAFPIIRYNIGDVISLSEDRKYIDSIGGRSDDMIYLPSGKKAAGMTMYYCSREILERSGKIKELYVTQKEVISLSVYYITTEVLSQEDFDIIRSVFDKYLEPGLQLEFIRTDKIRRKKNGKFQLFNSEII